jgi:AGCS family alanine or glycine:cation symporter
MAQIVDFLNGFLWSKVFIGFSLLSGVYYTLGTKFVQFRTFKLMIKYLADRKESDTGVSSFQALALSIAGRVGTGNIAGVASAIAIGGPGAVFWMWILALLGSATTFVESTLGQVYKTVDDGEFRGGPAYYIEKGLGIKWYASLFAIASAIALGYCTPGIQSNAIASSMNNAFGINQQLMGGLLVVVVGAIIFGGVKRISKVAEIVVPFMAISYIVVSLFIILSNASSIPAVFALIVKSAFGANQAFAGIVGTAISMGVKRGIYSNEAGMGTAVQAAAAADVSHPAKQGLVQAFSVYIDSLFVCSATAFMILITGMYNVSDATGGFIIENLPGVEAGPIFTQNAVESVVSGFGANFVAISLLFFAFTTILGNYYAAETNIAYISRNMDSKWILIGLRLVTLFAVFTGTTKTASLAWAIGDVGVGVMSWLNLIAIALLSKIAFSVLKDFEEQYKQTGDAVFNPEKLGIKNTVAWGTKEKKKMSV